MTGVLVLAEGGLSEALDATSQSGLSLAARLVLAGVFGIAGLTKLRDPSAAASAMMHFRIVRKHRGWSARALGVLELGIAAALVIGQGSAVPAFAAALLLGAFATLIASALRRGESFPCSCLSTHEDHIDARTLERTIVLLMVAIAAAAAPVRGFLDLREVVSAGVVAGGAIGVWTLFAAYRRDSANRRKFLKTQVDWQLAAELNADLVARHRQ